MFPQRHVIPASQAQICRKGWHIYAGLAQLIKRAVFSAFTPPVAKPSKLCQTGNLERGSHVFNTLYRITNSSRATEQSVRRLDVVVRE
jgi:hypothetical protein